ncbi:MAG: RrF2 family transcriptional regulator [Microthrixaceae bacterium]
MRLALTKRAGDAIRILLHLATLPEGTRMSSTKIAEASGVSHGNIPTLIAALSRAELLDCTRGPGGGCALSRDAEEITVAETVIAIEGALEPERCAIDDRRCIERDYNCGIHDTWRGVIHEMQQRLANLSIAEAQRRATAREDEYASRSAAREAGQRGELSIGVGVPVREVTRISSYD